MYKYPPLLPHQVHLLINTTTSTTTTAVSAQTPIAIRGRAALVPHPCIPIVLLRAVEVNLPANAPPRHPRVAHHITSKVEAEVSLCHENDPVRRQRPFLQCAMVMMMINTSPPGEL